MKNRNDSLCVSLWASALCLCGSFASAAPPPAVAIVNGEPIPRAELDAALAQRPPVVTPFSAAQERELRQEALAALIDERLMRQFLAKNAPPVPSEEVDRQVAALQRGLASQGKPLDDYLKENHQTLAQLRSNVELMQQWYGLRRQKDHRGRLAEILRRQPRLLRQDDGAGKPYRPASGPGCARRRTRRSRPAASRFAGRHRRPKRSRSPKRP